MEKHDIILTWLKIIGLILGLCFALYTWYSYRHLQMLYAKKLQSEIEFLEYQTGQANAGVTVTPVKEVKEIVREVLPPEILKEMKKNRETVSNLQQLVAELKEKVGEGQAVDKDGFWVYEDAAITAQVRKNDGWFTYRVKRDFVNIDIVETVSSYNVKRFRAQVTDSSGNVLKVKDFNVKLSEEEFKKGVKGTIWWKSTKWKITVVGAGAFLTGLLLQK